MKITFFKAGYCIHPEAIAIKGGSWKTIKFPSLFALIRHPEFGVILYDTGYSHRFFEETCNFPYRLYSLITPVIFKSEDSAVSQLQKEGIKPEDIKYIIISHFHGDHIGGLKDFPNAQFICFQSAYNSVKDYKGIKAVKAGFLSGLLPSDFEKRVIFIETKSTISLPSKYTPFNIGVDVFGDSSIIAVNLSGHVIGQLGLFLVDYNNQNYFLIADACWLSRSYEEFIKPNLLTNLIFTSKQEYEDTLWKIYQLHKLNPDIKIIPTHCQKTWYKINSEFMVRGS